MKNVNDNARSTDEEAFDILYNKMIEMIDGLDGHNIEHVYAVVSYILILVLNEIYKQGVDIDDIRMITDRLKSQTLDFILEDAERE